MYSGGQRRATPRDQETHLAEEPRDNVPKDNSLIRLVIIRRTGNTRQIPKIRLPLIQPIVARSSIKQEYSGCSFDKPSTVDQLDASVSHRLDTVGEGSGGSTSD
jgi:hypothetical protein